MAEPISETLGTALPDEMARVRDEVLAEYIKIGPSGAIAAALMRQSLDLAAKSMSEGDVVAMIRAYEDLKGWQL